MGGSTEQLPAPVYDAATVILCRDGEAGIQVYMLQRAESMRAFAKAWVFPGGQVEPEDFAPGSLARCLGLTVEKATARTCEVGDGELYLSGARVRRELAAEFIARYGMIPPDDVPDARLRPAVNLGAWMAAARELFEESGVCLFEPRNAAAVQAAGLGTIGSEGLLRPTPEVGERISREEGGYFWPLVEEVDLVLDTHRLPFMGRIVTPATQKYRYDTRFFAAALPAGQAPKLVGGEAVRGVWVTPEEALAHRERGDASIPPPTAVALRTLSRFSVVKELLEAYAG